MRALEWVRSSRWVLGRRTISGDSLRDSLRGRYLVVDDGEPSSVVSTSAYLDRRAVRVVLVLGVIVGTRWLLNPLSGPLAWTTLAIVVCVVLGAQIAGEFHLSTRLPETAGATLAVVSAQVLTSPTNASSPRAGGAGGILFCLLVFAEEGLYLVSKANDDVFVPRPWVARVGVHRSGRFTFVAVVSQAEVMSFRCNRRSLVSMADRAPRRGQPSA